MQAELNLQEGSLSDTLNRLQEQIRKQPAEPKLRIFLFQLYLLFGEWQKALNQLNVLRELDPSSLAMVQTYEQAVQCEVLRTEVFAGKRSPLLFGDPEHWLALMIQALQLTAEGQHASALQLREQALAQAPAVPGSIDGQSFAWLADADPRLGPVLEAIVNGHYYWVPFYRVARIEFEAPSDLRDLVWLPAQFTWANGGQTVGLVPTRYPGSESADDDALKLARKTDWITLDDQTQLGLGQRLIATDSDDYSLLDSREIVLQCTDQTPDATVNVDD